MANGVHVATAAENETYLARFNFNELLQHCVVERVVDSADQVHSHPAGALCSFKPILT